MSPFIQVLLLLLFIVLVAFCHEGKGTATLLKRAVVDSSIKVLETSGCNGSSFCQQYFNFVRWSAQNSVSFHENYRENKTFDLVAWHPPTHLKFEQR
jgi:hypothetical protein